jgi:hypothetical protein
VAEDEVIEATENQKLAISKSEDQNNVANMHVGLPGCCPVIRGYSVY